MTSKFSQLLEHLETLARTDGQPTDGNDTGPTRELIGRCSSQDWPNLPGDQAFAGLAGRVVKVVRPYSEGDPVAVLTQFLGAYGNAVGVHPHCMVGATRHGMNSFMAVVGDSSKARKGDAWTPVHQLLSRADPAWASGRVLGGLSSGEGLIWAVRDPIEKTVPVKEGKETRYERQTVDEGVDDKRLLVIEPELARVLRVMGRQGNTLSPVLRQSWDNGNLQTMTKTSPAQATGAHISVIGHITVEELRRELSEIETANGFANRFLWLVARRSAYIPEPQPFDGPAVESLAQAIGASLERARTVGRIVRDDAARKLWAAVYGHLSEAQPGLVGAILARAEAQVLRLSALYALLDDCDIIQVSHLMSALELWGYMQRSVNYIWANATGDPIADSIDKALIQTGELNRTAISNLFGRHISTSRIDQSLQLLATLGRAKPEIVATEGRSAEVWRPLAK